MKGVVLLGGLFLSVLLLPWKVSAQSKNDTLPSGASLSDCIHFALTHEPALQQSYLDEQITERTIRSKLAEWYPQIGVDADFEHYFQLPTSFVPNASGNKEAVKSGLFNTSGIGLAVNQTIFNTDVMLAARSAKDVRRQASQNTTNTKINTIVDVTKAYYDVLLTQRQEDILEEDILRLQKSLKDAYSQYQAGIVDKTDYQQATISLNNSLADQRSAAEQVKGKYAYLEQLMGYSSGSNLRLSYDTAAMEKNVYLDTTQTADYQHRIEYRLLQTARQLQIDNVSYYKWGFLPSLSAYYDYNFAYMNDAFSKLYTRNFPNSLIGLNLSIPIFQGTQRIQNLRIAELEVTRANWDIAAIQYQINTEFVQAMSTYKANLNQWQTLKDNLNLAKEVYNTISLQYKAGVKAYLDVITAETGLRTAEFNYLNALYNVLSSKLDVEKAMGTVALD